MTATLTTAEAAALLQIRPDSFRKKMSRARAEGVDLRVPAELWPDRRSPRWDRERLLEWVQQRPRATP